MADQEQPDEKPAIDTHINIKVASKDNEVNFRIKKRTPLQKLMTTYCERQGKAAMSVRFTYDGKRIDGTMSPEDVFAT